MTCTLNRISIGLKEFSVSVLDSENIVLGTGKTRHFNRLRIVYLNLYLKLYKNKLLVDLCVARNHSDNVNPEQSNAESSAKLVL